MCEFTKQREQFLIAKYQDINFANLVFLNEVEPWVLSENTILNIYALFYT